jgi:hypothetical protein
LKAIERNFQMSGTMVAVVGKTTGRVINSGTDKEGFGQ